MDNQRNMIWAVVLTGIILIGWDLGLRYFYPHYGEHPVAAASAPARPGALPAAAPQSAASAAPAAPRAPATREGGLQSADDQAREAAALKTALAAADRVTIDAPGLKGSINLTGGVIDDLTLARYREDTAAKSPPVRLFSPAGSPAQHFAQAGWLGTGIAAPDGQTRWHADATRLTPQHPVTLTWTNPTGQTFALTYAIDSDYLVTITQSVRNDANAPVSVQPFALINRTNRTASLNTSQVHSGPLGAFDGRVDFGLEYPPENGGDRFKLCDATLLFFCVASHTEDVHANTGTTNWVGFTDIYWMSTLIADADARATSAYRALGGGLFRADLVYPVASVAAHKTLTQRVRLFAGAKENRLLERYERDGIANFSLAIDWGWFRWFEKPIFWLLDWLFNQVGNFGVAIILLTLVVRALMFPVAQRQFASMAAMRAIQPKMKTIQERYKDDKQRQQQEVMALYKEEGVNPLAGCLPMFLQIPMFFALYKVLVLTIEMRHQPFFGFIHDLSAPDPTHVLNLFGLLPFTPPGLFGIGALAIALGATMWLQFKLQPAAMDPSQQQVMAIMPWMMMFVMASFASGLLIYWITSNLLTIAQQHYLYSRHPQLKAQAAKDQLDIDRQAQRDSKA